MLKFILYMQNRNFTHLWLVILKRLRKVLL